MATVDSLDIQVEGSVKKANQAIDTLISKLGKLAGALKIDASSLKNIGNQVNLGGVSKSLDTVKEKAKEVGKTVSESVQNASNSLDLLTEKYRDLGKGFQFFGDESQIQKAINQYSNALEKAKLKKEELESSGKTEGQNYEHAIRDLMKYSNIVDSLNSKLNGMSDLSISVPEIHIASPEMQRSLDEIVDDLDRYMETLHRASGDYMPFAEAQRSIEELTERFPDAIEEIKFFKSELEGLSSQRIEMEVPEIPEQAKTILKDMSDQEQHEWFQNLPSVKAQLEQVNSYVEDLTRNTREFTGEWNGIKIPDYLKGNNGIAEIVDTESLDLAEKKIEELQKRFREAGMNFVFEGNADELESEIKRVYAQLNKLFEKEDKAISLGSIDTKSFESLQYDIAEATNKLDILRNYKTDLLNTSLEESAQRAKEFSESLDKLEIPEIREENLEKLQKMLEKAEIDLDKLRTKLENGITMGKITENVDDRGFRNIQEQIALSEKTVEALKEKIKSVSPEIEKASGNIEGAFADKFANLKIPEIKTDSLKQLEKELQKAEAELDKLQTKLQNDITMGRIKADFGDKGYQKAAEQIALTEKRIEAVKEKMKTANSEAGKTNGIKKFESAVKNVSSAVKKIGDTLSKSIQYVKRFSAAITKLGSAGLKKIGSAARGAASGIAKLTKSFADSSKSSKKHDKTMSDAIKTALKYAFSIRSLFMLIRNLKDAFKDGANNLALYSSEFNASISSLTSALGALKNSLAVAFAPIVNVVQPYITAFINMMIDAANAVGRFFAALTGKKLATQALKYYKDYASGISGVAGAAKKASDALNTLGIDELNIINDKDSGGGGGGGGDLLPSDMFEDVAIEGEIADWAKRIREAFLAEDWEALGSEIASMLNAGLQKVYDVINWDNVGPRITYFVDAFTRTLNSLVDNLDWDLLGRTIGAGINTIANTFNLLLEGIGFENLGSKLSEGLRGAISEVDWKNLGNLIGNYFMVAWRIAEGFVEDMWRINPETLMSGWAELGTAIGNAINGIFEKIDFARIAKTLTDGFRGILEVITYALNTIDFKAIADKINAGLDALYNGLKWETIGEQITAFTAAVSKAFNDLLTFDFGRVGQIIGAGITDIVRAFNQLTGEGGIDFELLGSKIAGGLRGLFSEIPWEEFGNALGNGFMVGWRILNGFITNMSQQSGAGLTGWAELGVSLGNSVNGIFDRIDFGAIGTMLSNGFNGVIQTLKNFIATVNWEDVAVNLSTGINNFIHGVNWAEAGATLSEFVVKLLGVFQDVAQQTDWEALGVGIGEFLSNIEWGTILGTVFDTIWEIASGLISGLLDTDAGKVIVAIAAGMAAIKTLVGGAEIITTVGKFVGEFGTSIGKLAPIASGIVGKIGPILGSIGSVIFSPTGLLIGGIVLGVGLIRLLIGGIVLGVGLIIANWDKIKEAAGQVKDWVAEKWEAVKTKTQEIWGNVSEFLSNTWNNVKTWASDKFEAAKESISNAWENTKNTTKAVWEFTVNNLNDKWDSIKEKASTTWENMKTTIGDTWETVKENTKAVWEFTEENLSRKWESIKTKASDTWENMKDKIGRVWEDVKTNTKAVWDFTGEKLSNKWDSIKEKASTTWDNMKTKIGDVWEATKKNTSDVWENVSTNLSNKWESVKTNASNTWENLKTTISKGWENVRTRTDTTWQNISGNLRDKWNGIKNSTSLDTNTVFNTVSRAWDNTKSTTMRLWDEIRSRMRSTTEGIRNDSSNVFSETLNIVSDKFGNMKDRIGSLMGDARDLVSGAIEKMKSFFNFNWELPHFSLPHLSVSGSFSLNPPSVPHFDIDWYAKGGIFDSASVIGVGEHGAEAVMPLEHNTGWIDSLADRINGRGSSDELMQEQNALMRELLQAVREGKKIYVQIGEREIVNAYDRGKTRQGYSFSY